MKTIEFNKPVAEVKAGDFMFVNGYKYVVTGREELPDQGRVLISALGWMRGGRMTLSVKS